MRQSYKAFICCAFSALAFTACQTTPVIHTESVKPQATIEPLPPPSRVQVSPYPESGIERQSQPLPSTTPTVVKKPQAVIIPPSTIPKTTTTLKDGRGIPAYEKLMQDYIQRLKQNNLVEAEKLLLQAQRIAPQSADVYRELSRLANLRKQASNAEAFAQKGLTFAQTKVQQRQLWEQILQSAQLRNDTIRIQTAKQQIAQLK